VGDTHIGKRKLNAGPRKDKGKKAKTTDEPVLESVPRVRMKDVVHLTKSPI
jgi:hypothetical protein